jgi:hypothetical protein
MRTRHVGHQAVNQATYGFRSDSWGKVALQNIHSIMRTLVRLPYALLQGFHLLVSLFFETD